MNTILERHQISLLYTIQYKKIISARTDIRFVDDIRKSHLLQIYNSPNNVCFVDGISA